MYPFAVRSHIEEYFGNFDEVETPVESAHACFDVSSTEGYDAADRVGPTPKTPRFVDKEPCGVIVAHATVAVEDVLHAGLGKEGWGARCSPCGLPYLAFVGALLLEAVVVGSEQLGAAGNAAPGNGDNEAEIV